MSKITKDQEPPGDQPKEKYRVTNWAVYNQALVNRGSITIYFSQEAIEGWSDEGPVQRGGQYVQRSLHRDPIDAKSSFQIGVSTDARFCSEFIEIDGTRFGGTLLHSDSASFQVFGYRGFPHPGRRFDQYSHRLYRLESIRRRRVESEKARL